MGYSFGAVILDGDFGGRYESLLARLVAGRYVAAGPITLREAMLNDFNDTAAGGYLGRTLIIDHSWPFDCSFQPAELGPLDVALAALSTEVKALCVLADETSMTFGFTYFDGGERVRVRQVDPDGVRSDAGELLPAEGPFAPDSRDDSERIMAVIAHVLRARIGHLLDHNQVPLTRFERQDDD